MEIELEPDGRRTRVRVVETRPLAALAEFAAGRSSARSPDGARRRRTRVRRALRRTRRDVLELIGAAGEASATQLARELPVSRQAIAKHLASLAAAGLVADRRAGREVLYRVTPAPMSGAMAGWRRRRRVGRAPRGAAAPPHGALRNGPFERRPGRLRLTVEVEQPGVLAEDAEGLDRVRVLPRVPLTSEMCQPWPGSASSANDRRSRLAWRSGRRHQRPGRSPSEAQPISVIASACAAVAGARGSGGLMRWTWTAGRCTPGE